MVRQVDPTGRIPVPLARGRRAPSTAGSDFRTALRQAQRRAGEVRFSAHALERLRQRDINFTASDVRRVSQAAEKLAGKGGRQSLVVMDGVGLILDVANRTVVTAVERRALRENVFTNIDSAVFA